MNEPTNDVVFSRRRLLQGAAAAALSACAPALAGADGGGNLSSPGGLGVGRRAPELIGGPGDFLNTNERALRLYGENGLLAQNACVLVDFWEFTCINCIRTFPYLREWHKRYKDRGLAVVGIHTPEFAFAQMRFNVADSARAQNLVHPLLVDGRYQNWNAYGNRFWPRKYLLDKNGTIVYDHAGEGAYGQTEAKIQQLLRAADPKRAGDLPPLMEPVRAGDRPGAVCYPQTPEIYAGYERGASQFGSPGGLRRDRPFDYGDINIARGGRRENGRFYARGAWQATPQHLRHARETGEPFDDYVALFYMAIETNAVIRREGYNAKPFDLFLLQDDKPIAPEDKGADIRYSSDGRSYVRVDEGRMYQLTKNRKWGRHYLKLGTTSSALGLYSFTFAACTDGGAS